MHARGVCADRRGGLGAGAGAAGRSPHRAAAHRPALARALEARGALAIRIEQSKLGFPIARWLQLVEADDPWALYRLAVVVLGGKTEAATCGMQFFSLPDAQVSLDRGFDAAAANALLGVLNVYQIAEDPLLLSGHTFSPDAESPRRGPDANYPPGDTCHNPFGVWRLGPPGRNPRHRARSRSCSCLRSSRCSPRPRRRRASR
jgi:hypothetical protein